MPFVQRGQHADRAEHAAHDVVDRTARPQRTAYRPGHVGETGHHLHHFVQRETVFVRTVQKAFMRDINQPGIAFAQRRIIETQARHAARFEVLDEDVRGIDQLVQRGQSRFAIEIERDTLLVAIEGAKKSRARTKQTARTVAARRFDLDDFGAKVAKNHPAGRPHHHMRQLDYANPRQRQRALLLRQRSGCGSGRRNGSGRI